MIIYNYITTNLRNNKKYVGMHTSSEVDDGYLGSGVALLSAVKKWKGGVDAEREIGVSRGGISGCANGVLATSGGFIWKFKETKK